MPLSFSYLSSLPKFHSTFYYAHYSAESPVHNTRSLFSTNHRDSLVFVFLHLVWVHFVNWQFRNWNVCTRKFPAVCLSLLLLAITRRCKRAHKNNHQNFICWLQFSLFSAGRFFSVCAQELLYSICWIFRYYRETALFCEDFMFVSTQSISNWN